MTSTRCFTIGLTGGIASGKSTVSSLFSKLGCPVIDADIVAREVVKPHSIGLSQLIKVFGDSILDKNDILDRAKLRKIVFNNKQQLMQLNNILHPLIHTNIMDQINKVKEKYCIIVIPLLCGSTLYSWLNRILVVDVSEATQYLRLEKRDAITHELAMKMIHSQCTRNERLDIADDVINNEQPIDDLQNQVKKLNSLYKSF